MHSRFQVLLNDLEGVGVKKTQEERVQKFADVLPEDFDSLITSMDIADKLDDYSLDELFGIVSTFEEKLAKRKDSRRKSSDDDVALISTSKKLKKVMIDSDDEDDSSDDESLAHLEERMALLSQKIENKKGNKMKSSFDPKKAECFKCGNIGHVKADCRTKSENFKKKVDFEAKAYKYKKKYNDLKKSLEEKKSDKVLLAEHWDDENSSDDEDEDKCFIVLLENNNAPSKFAEDYDAAKRTNTLSFSGNRSSV